MKVNVLDRVLDLAADLFLVSRAELSPESSPDQIPAWDSVQHLSLVLAVEETLGIQFTPEEMEGMKSLGRISELAQSKLDGAS